MAGVSSFIAQVFYGDPFEDHLSTGDNIKTSKEIILWPEPAPPVRTMADWRVVPIGSIVSVVDVFETVERVGMATYGVAIYDSQGSFLAQGWTTSRALRNQDKDFRSQAESMVTEIDRRAWVLGASKIAAEYNLNLDAIETIYVEGALIEKWPVKLSGVHRGDFPKVVAELRDMAASLYGDRPPIHSVDPSTLRGPPNGG